jgi:hypothetical protein
MGGGTPQRKGVLPVMTTFETLQLMISFGALIVIIMQEKKK